VENHPAFIAITQFLLTQKNTWRRTVDKRDGFPADNKALKARMMALLQQFNDNETLRVNLENLRLAPPVTYSAEQWEILNIITELLPLLAAQLTLIFSEQNVVDFSEVSMAALRALDEQGSPTELALMLDYQIKHLLIDEFQDTSIMQYRLLEKLTAGWQCGDGKTLFLVGDPMQSIYRFRQAEVGLFLKAQQEGIGAVSLESLVLQTNFRSTTTIVNWINHNFQAIFPQHTDISSGAVPYNSSIAIKDSHNPAVPVLHPFLGQTNKQEEKILTLIQQEIAENPQHTIAILVRSRKHLAEVIPLLKQANINFSAVEIESLAQQSIVHDLLALTRALIHLSDKIAWLAVLRAPWCGLTLKDLHIIANAASNKPLWYTLQNFQTNSALSMDAQQRLAHLVPILADAISQRGRLKLRAWIEHTWRAVKGDLCIETAAELSAAQTYFELVEKIADSAVLPDISILETEVAQRYATPEIISDCKVHLMTIHKAKGLEFDMVILPHLQSRGRHNEEQLLLWLDRTRANGENDLILAPIKAKKDAQDAIYQYLQHVEKSKTLLEMTRVLYVATTRAKKSLHLLADLNVGDGKLKEPDKNSFLSLLWDPFKIAAEKLLTTETYAESATLSPVAEQTLRRIKSAYFLTTPTPAAITLNSSSDFRFDWPDDMPRHIGTVVHRCLQQIANEGISNWHTTKIHTEQVRWQKWLLQLGLNGANLTDGIALIKQIISQTLEDPIGRWLLDENHLEQNNEFPLTTMVEGVATHMLIDRTFVDAEGVRWIIDYKTSALTSENKSEFLQQAKQQHQEQLKKYADALRYLDTRPIRLGLYFPAFSGWIDWV